MNFRQNRAARSGPRRGFRPAGGVILAGLAIVYLCSSPGGAQPGPGGGDVPEGKDRKEGKGENRRPPQDPSQRSGSRGFGNKPGDPLNGLSEEERRRVREVLAKVWQDPEVMAAKESVRISTEEWRAAMKEAVNRVDPGVAELMNKMYEQSRSAEVRRRYEESMGKGGPGGPGRPGGPPKGPPGMRPGAGPNGMPGLPEYVRALDEEKKKIFLEARAKASEVESIRTLRSQMEKLYLQEKTTREERHRISMEMRRALREEMIRIDPRVAEFVPDVLTDRQHDKLREQRPDKPRER